MPSLLVHDRLKSPMYAPARLYDATCTHVSDTSVAVSGIRKVSCTLSAKAWASSCKTQASAHLKAQPELTDVRSRRCICHSQQSDKSSTTDEASTSGRLSPATASRRQIFTNCSAVSAAFVAVAAVIRLVAPVTSPFLFKSDLPAVQALLQISNGDQANHALVSLATAGLVTAARTVLLANSPDFAEATNASNKQVLTPLVGPDLLWLSCLPGISEEFLFRGALIPGTFPDWRGAVISAAVFGALHNSGGRNWIFAGWAAAVGLLYGAVFIGTQDLLVPMGAHCLANYASAALWLKTPPAKDAKPD